MKKLRVIGMFLVVLMSTFMFTGCQIDLSSIFGSGNKKPALNAEIAREAFNNIWNAIPSSVKNNQYWEHFDYFDIIKQINNYTLGCGEDIINKAVVLKPEGNQENDEYFGKASIYINDSNNLVFEMLAYSSPYYYGRYIISGDFNDVNTVTIDGLLLMYAPNHEFSTQLWRVETRISLVTGTMSKHEEYEYEEATLVQARIYAKEMFVFKGNSTVNDATYYVYNNYMVTKIEK